jgi:hypothetical protein
LIEYDTIEYRDISVAVSFTDHSQGGLCMSGSKSAIIFGLALVLIMTSLAGAVQRTVLVELFTSNA